MIVQLVTRLVVLTFKNEDTGEIRRGLELKATNDVKLLCYGGVSTHT